MKDAAGGEPPPSGEAGAPPFGADTEPRKQPDGGVGLAGILVGTRVTPPARPRKTLDVSKGLELNFGVFD